MSAPKPYDWHRQNPEAYRALAAVNNAVKAGRLVKKPCAQCGSTYRLRCQHADYAHPLEVTWLCQRCHSVKLMQANSERLARGEYRRCDLADCDRRHFCRGFCRLHFERLLRHGDPEKVLLRLSPRGAPMAWLRENAGHHGDGCLLWPFSRHPDGRAHLHNKYPARIMCELAHGPAPSSEHEAAHSCGRGHEACVNPRHLRWATPTENAADKELHGTVIRGSDHPAAKLTATDVRRIRELARSMQQREIGKLFGIASSTTNKIIHGKAWRHVA